jgi:hypothetical protein
MQYLASSVSKLMFSTSIGTEIGRFNS